MPSYTLWVVPAAFGGASGRFGKTPHGVAAGLVVYVLLIWIFFAVMFAANMLGIR